MLGELGVGENLLGELEPVFVLFLFVAFLKQPHQNNNKKLRGIGRRKSAPAASAAPRPDARDRRRGRAAPTGAASSQQNATAAKIRGRSAARRPNPLAPSFRGAARRRPPLTNIRLKRAFSLGGNG